MTYLFPMEEETSQIPGLTKIGIAGGAVYVTLDQGIWQGPHEGVNSLSRLTDTIPGLQDKITKQKTEQDRGTSAKGMWNSGVQTVFAGLATTPDKCNQLTQSATTYLRNNLTAGESNK